MFVTITRGGRSAFVRETIAEAGLTGKKLIKYRGMFPIIPQAPDSVPENVRNQLDHDDQKIAIVQKWLCAYREATEAKRCRAVIESLKSAALDTMLVLGTGAVLTEDDKRDLQQVIVGLREIVD